jgi:hypothetical protein
MTRAIGRFADKVLDRLLPSATASAGHCSCQCRAIGPCTNACPGGTWACYDCEGGYSCVACR